MGTNESSGTVLKVLEDINEVIVDTGDNTFTADIESVEVVEKSVDLDVEIESEDVEGITDEEVTVYQNKMAVVQTQQGQPAKSTYARFAITAMSGVWTLDDIVELSGASRDTVRRVVDQEEIRDVVNQVGKAKTGKRRKAVYITLTNNGESQW